MSRERQDRVLSLLIRAEGWRTASSLADAVGVTPRSIRSYVTALNARVPDGVVIESGANGYRAGSAAGRARRAETDSPAPKDRTYRLFRELLSHRDGIDVYRSAADLHVSDATIDADLSRVRAVLEDTDVRLERRGARAQLRGTEVARRRLISRLVHDEMGRDTFDLASLHRVLGEEAVGPTAVSILRSGLSRGLTDLGYQVNEYGMGDVVLHIAIAVDRARRGNVVEQVDPVDPSTEPPITALIRRVVESPFPGVLGDGDLRYLTSLVETRVVAPKRGAGGGRGAELDGEVHEAVAAVVKSAAGEFLIDIDHPDFIERLALHVQKLRERARERAWSRNAMTRSLKGSYPMIFDVAVYLADGLKELIRVPLLDDEIAYLAMHVGGRLDRDRAPRETVSATVVSPGYYELADTLHGHIATALGGAVAIEAVDTTMDPAWSEMTTDLIITTIDPGEASERFVRIQPFLTDNDIERVNAAAARVRRTRRLAGLRTEMERYFSPDAFVPDLAPDQTVGAVIDLLGRPLIDAGVIDADYLVRTLEREELSSTAFTDSLAVPHAIGMTATRTAISVGIAPSSLAWGDGRVQVVALVAFSESDREAFQTVFEQLVEVFSEPDAVQRILRRARTFPEFLDELVAVVDG